MGYEHSLQAFFVSMTLAHGSENANWGCTALDGTVVVVNEDIDCYRLRTFL